ncbi:GNAT family N-acetyltransferase [Chlorogloeopsis sp. ULAP02]|uniref:GNAT family N-acetyltransferase n=1 Tax=Chlorogloeopsis sp. ULAP02 TaxID=3107926 RepID=UPI0031369FFD
MIALTTRLYQGESDLQAIVDLLNACELVDRLEEWASVSTFRVGMEDPSVAQVKDILLWEDSDGKLIGFSQMGIPAAGQENDGWLWFRVHPQARDGKLEREMIAWGERRLREVASERGVVMKFRSELRDKQRDRIALLESCGFICERCFLRMARSLLEPFPAPQLPERFTLRQTLGEEEAQAWIEMHHQSRIDHWGYYPLTMEEYQYYLSNPNYQPELNLVAVAPDGTLASYCECYICPEDNDRNGRKDGWIGDLGTRRGFRRRGLGRAVLLAGMDRLKAAGMETARLGVDAQNPNGAKQLYESVGFHQLDAFLVYIKEIGK